METGNLDVEEYTEVLERMNVLHGRTITMMNFVMHQLITSYTSLGLPGQITTEVKGADDNGL